MTVLADSDVPVLRIPGARSDPGVVEAGLEGMVSHDPYVSRQLHRRSGQRVRIKTRDSEALDGVVLPGCCTGSPPGRRRVSHRLGAR